MSIALFLNLGAGSLSAGFDRIESRLEVNGKLVAKQWGSLPGNPELQDLYHKWQFYYGAYYDRHSQPVRGELPAIEIDNTGVTGFAVTNFDRVRQDLELGMQQWLDSSSFADIGERLCRAAVGDPHVVIIIETEEDRLYRLPWHCWRAIASCPRAEITFSLNTYHRQASNSSRQIPRILAVFGDSEGIDLAADAESIQYLQADVVTLLEPSIARLRAELEDDRGWDLLFFAGHSADTDCGAIRLNPIESTTFTELSQAVTAAIGRGLKLAIFNCCSGLGVAASLASMHIPTAIVMREALPNRVAQDFLQTFLRSFESGNPLLIALAHARLRLRAIEADFPCATWLPAVFWNPTVELPTWQSLCDRARRRIAPWQLGAIVLAATAAIWGVRTQGYLEPPELAAYDLAMAVRPMVEPPDDRLVIISVDRQRTIGDRVLLQTLQKLHGYQPKAIGLDIYRDRASDGGYRDLTAFLQQQSSIVSPCLMSGNSKNARGITAPAGVGVDRIGFTNFSLDADRTIRRQIIGMAPVARGCTSDRSFSLQLALKYLGITTADEAENGNVSIGNRELPVLGHYFGGYRSTTAQENLRGFQVMLNYRHAPQVAPQVSLEDVLSDRVPPQAIAGKIALIGYIGADPHDTWRSLGKADKLSGVVVHAQMTSNLLSHILDDRPLITTWGDLPEFGWILLWGTASGLIWLKLRGYRLWLAQVGTMAIAIATCEVYLSARSVWLPIIPTAIAIVATPLVATGVDRYLDRQERSNNSSG